MEKAKNIVITGASESGYGGAIAKELSSRGENVFISSSNPTAKKEEEVRRMGGKLIETPVEFDLKLRENGQRNWEQAKTFLKKNGVETIDGLVLCHAGGLPRRRKEMMEHGLLLGKILEQRVQLTDMPDWLIDNIGYVDAYSYQDIIEWSKDMLAKNAPVIATSYRDKMPGYIIAPFKRTLEKIMQDVSKKGLNSVAVALPEAITPATKMFNNLALVIIYNAIEAGIKCSELKDPDLSEDLETFNSHLTKVDRIKELLNEVEALFQGLTLDFLKEYEEDNFQAVNLIMKAMTAKIEKKKLDATLIATVEIISKFVKKATAKLVVKQFILDQDFEAGETRLIQYNNLLEGKTNKVIDLSNDVIEIPTQKQTPIQVSAEETAELLNMYGDNFRLINEFSVSEDGKLARGIFEIPTNSDDFDFLRDHFKKMPILPGAIQEEAANQLCVAVGAREKTNTLPLLTELEDIFFDTLALPGDTLKIEVEQIETSKRQETWRFKIQLNGHPTTGKIKGIPLKKATFEKHYQAKINNVLKRQLAKIELLEKKMGKTTDSPLKGNGASINDQQLLIQSLKRQLENEK